MSRIFDNIDLNLLSALPATMQVSQRSDFCVGYLKQRGWQAIDGLVMLWDQAAGQVCRVLVGMPLPPQEEICELYRQADTAGLIDNATASHPKCQFAFYLREQIAHRYDLTESEFAHILDTFPLVAEPTKVAALKAWRDVQRGLIQ